MREIPLTQGKVALVDDCDFEYLNQWKWYAHRNGHTFYAKCGSRYMHQLLSERLGFKHRADHKNRNGLNNRRCNLRDATQKQNMENRALSCRNQSGHKGIYWESKRSKWRVQIGHNGKRFHIGYFDTLKDAVEFRRAAEKKYFTHAETV